MGESVCDVSSGGAGSSGGGFRGHGLDKAVLKPKLRGWLHVGMLPVSFVAGLVLVFLASGAGRVAVVVYLLCTGMLFGMSSVYHRGSWKPGVKKMLQRFDHSAIFLLIAGTYTPVAVLLTSGSVRVVMLMLAWGGAVVGVVLRFLPRSPRWLFVPIYLALGLAAVGFLPQILAHGGVLVVALIAVGGGLYVAGAVVFATRFPDPSPRWFGFHEIFHGFTIGGWGVQYTAILLTVLGAARL